MQLSAFHVWMRTVAMPCSALGMSYLDLLLRGLKWAWKGFVLDQTSQLWCRSLPSKCSCVFHTVHGGNTPQLLNLQTLTLQIPVCHTWTHTFERTAHFLSLIIILKGLSASRFLLIWHIRFLQPGNLANQHWKLFFLEYVPKPKDRGLVREPNRTACFVICCFERCRGQI